MFYNIKKLFRKKHITPIDKSLNKKKDKLINDFIEEYNYYNNSCCPYCGTISQTQIKATKKCPSCKQKIIKRKNKLSKKEMLLTETKTLEYDKLIDKYNNVMFYSDLYNRVFKDAEIHNKYKKTGIDIYKIEEKFLNLKTSRDFCWNLFNELQNVYLWKWYNLMIKYSKDDLKYFDKMLYIDAYFDFYETCTFALADICIHTNRKDIARDIMYQLAYIIICKEYLIYILHYDDLEPNDNLLYYSLSRVSRYLLEKLDFGNLKSPEYKKVFISNCRGFFTNIFEDKNVYYDIFMRSLIRYTIENKQ